jgi:uncharacterized protein (DUF608 family)
MRKFVGLMIAAILFVILLNPTLSLAAKREYNGWYEGEYLNRVAFPIGGIGAGMICLEGTGAISHVSVRNQLQAFNEPSMYAAVCVKNNRGNIARVLEGPVLKRKIFGGPNTGRGLPRTSFGLPRFDEARFLARFPFANIELKDSDIPLDVKIVGWSPFIPGDADNSSLPVGALEYSFSNPTKKTIEAVFSFNTVNFMRAGFGNRVLSFDNGFVLWQPGLKDEPHLKGAFVFFVEGGEAVVDHCWFKGKWFDPQTLTWENIKSGRLLDNPPVQGPSAGASLFVPLEVKAGQTKTIRLMMSWYVPETAIRFGQDVAEEEQKQTCSSGDDCGDEGCVIEQYHSPWYSGKFDSVTEVANYFRSNYDELRKKSELFKEAFYDTSLQPAVIEAAAANLSILKSPTVMRQKDGRLWCWEGCNDETGCCAGSCTHVWNYAVAICHLFPSLERSLRQTEFNESQFKSGEQIFRSGLPIRPTTWSRYAAADGQLGGIMKVYRDWRISGDTMWLRSIWPKVKQSLGYCIRAWDPKQKGILEEPHHNTYDIEYWGPEGHCGSFYLGALEAAIRMGQEMGDDVKLYRDLLSKGQKFLEAELYNGEYFYHKIQTEGLNAKFEPITAAGNGPGYADIIKALNEQGPKYQYGTGCLSDGVLGFWMARMCGLGQIINEEKLRSNLNAIYKYNFKTDLSDHANPQRPTYANGKEGGLLLCTWPRGGELSIPFVYSHEVWTGIEYQVASHLMIEGMVDKGLDIVRACRDRYDGRVRNPFDEYECGHWYARAMSSYGLIQGLTGVRYDAVEKKLYIDSRVGDDFKSFLSTATGFGSVGLKRGKPFVEVKSGSIDVKDVIVNGKKSNI